MQKHVAMLPPLIPENLDRRATDTSESHSTIRLLKRWLAGLGLCFVFVLAPALGETIYSEKSAVATESLEQRGRQLREAIEQDYQRLEESKAMTPMSGGNITSTVSRYIPIGTPFDDAEQILRNAGFEVGPRVGPNTPTGGIKFPNPKYILIAKIIALHASIFSFRTVSVYASLTPEDPNSYNKVKEVSGSIYLSFP